MTFTFLGSYDCTKICPQSITKMPTHTYKWGSIIFAREAHHNTIELTPATTTARIKLQLLTSFMLEPDCASLNPMTVNPGPEFRYVTDSSGVLHAFLLDLANRYALLELLANTLACLVDLLALVTLDDFDFEDLVKIG